MCALSRCLDPRAAMSTRCCLASFCASLASLALVNFFSVASAPAAALPSCAACASVAGVGHDARGVSVALVSAHGLPAGDHLAGGGLRVFGARDGGDREPAGGLRAGQHGHVSRGHAAADDDRELAGGADRVDLRGIQGLAGAVVAAHRGFRLGGGDVQRPGADVVDAAVGQLIDESDQGLGLSRQSHDRFVAQQGAASRGSISLWPMCTPSTLMPLRRPATPRRRGRRSRRPLSRTSRCPR